MNIGGRDIRIGELRQRLVIERPVRASDGGGGATESWQAVATVWARLRPLAGEEITQADALVGKVSHEIVIRYRTDLQPEMRFRRGGRLFDIRASLDVDERHRFLRCLVEEREL